MRLSTVNLSGLELRNGQIGTFLREIFLRLLNVGRKARLLVVYSLGK